ncbi:MAG: helix-turn-helix transcriptional regulator, partial [Myxococcota bacterium]
LPHFADAGPITEYCFVFPRVPVRIEHEGAAGFIADVNVATLYNVGQPYHRQALDPAGDRSDWFALAPEVVREILREVDPASADEERRLFRSPFAWVSSPTYWQQRELFSRVRAGMVDVLEVEESVVALLAEVLARDRSVRRWTEVGQRSRELVESVRLHLNRRLGASDGLSEIARAVGVSVFHICRTFRRVGGSSIHAYRNALRLRQSLERVAAGDDLLAIALDLGFSSHSHFTASFGRAFGLAPSAARGLSVGARRQLERLSTGRIARRALSRGEFSRQLSAPLQSDRANARIQ